MVKRAESIGLYINSDGPNLGGKYERTGQANLVINGANAGDPTKYSLDGLKHFTNWDAGLNSLDSTNVERFEYSNATEYVGYKFNATKIKIVDEVAAVAYPEFTDVTKVVWQHQNGGLYQARGCRTYVGYDTTSTGCDPVFNGGFLPLVNERDLNAGGIDGYYHNIAILIEYDGYYANGPTTMGFNAALVGKKELFTYSPSPTDDPSRFYFYPGLTNSFPILNSRYSNIISNYTDFATNPSSRLTDTQVVEDYDNLVNYSPSYQSLPNELKTIYYNNTYPQTSIIGLSVNFAFLGYAKVSIIKYSAIQKCGKVDIFQRKSGNISSVANNSVVTSTAHDLQDGDIVKITGAVGSELNGVKYIQVNNANTFTVYDDNVFLTRTSITGYDTAKSSPKWVLVGSIYDNSRQGWSFKKSIISPTGRNGYTHSGSYGTENNVGLPAAFDKFYSFGQIATLDLNYSQLFETASDPYNSLLPVRNRYSRLDALWGGPEHYVNDYRFGSDIDLKKIAGQYRLLVGEQGPDIMPDFATQLVNIPNSSPYGRVHDFTLSFDASKVMTITVNNTINASTGTGGAISTPPEMYSSCSDTGYIFYVPTNSFARIDTAASQSANNLAQEYKCSSYAVNTGYLTSTYWFGAMLYHLPNRFKMASDNGYFTDYALDYLLTGVDYSSISVLDYYKFYPYVDNFGKSVALDYSSGKVLAIVGSTTKTDLTFRPESASCGPVHVFDITGTVSSLQRIASNTDVVTPSKKYGPQADRARKFAQCIKAVNGAMAFGKSKPYEMQNVFAEFSDTSSILVYKFNGTTYDFNSDVINVCNFSKYQFGSLLPVYKEKVLRDKLGEATSPDQLYYVYPSDRFGDYFDFNGDTIATNAFDLYNENGFLHEDRSFPDALCDYIQVYERGATRWEFMAKLSATIDSANNKYDYAATLYPNNFFSLRGLGNKTYANSSDNGMTWDTDLTGAFVLADDRVIVKDPLGYVIFQKNWQQPPTGATNRVVAQIFEYFRYQEHFVATDYGNLSHTKFSKMYNYANSAPLKMLNDTINIKNESTVPVHFMSLPASIDVNSVSFYVTFTSDPTNVKMILYKNDPRMTLTINHDYMFLTNGYETFGEIPGDMLLVNKRSDDMRIFAAGALDADIYHLGTVNIDAPLAKTITPSSVVGNVARFDLTLSDVSLYKVPGSAIQNTIRVINAGVYADHKVLELYDVTQPTFDPNISVDDTLIVGFTFANIGVTDYYKAPFSTVYYSNENSITSMTAFTNQLIPTEVIPRKYECVSDRITRFTGSKVQYTYDGKAKYRNPVLGLGISQVSSATANEPSSFTKSYQLFTSENVDLKNTQEMTYGELPYTTQNYREALRSLDVNKLDYLSLYISSNPTAENNLTLLMPNSVQSTGNMDLYINNLGKNNNITLYLESSAFGSGYIPLNMRADSPIEQTANLTIVNYLVGSTGVADLVMYNSFLEETLPLRLEAPTPVPIDSSHELYIYGGLDNFSIYKENSNVLYMSGTLSGYSEGSIQLRLEVDPSFALDNKAPLFINNYDTIVPVSGRADLFLYNTDTQEINWIKRNASTVLYMGGGAIATTGTMTLYLSRKGDSGEEETEKTVTLHLNNVQGTGNVDLFIPATAGVSNTVNLFLPVGTGNQTNQADVFIRGYEE